MTRHRAQTRPAKNVLRVQNRKKKQKQSLFFYLVFLFLLLLTNNLAQFGMLPR